MYETHWLTVMAPVLDRLRCGVTVADARRPERPLIYANDAFERLTGYGREHVLGQGLELLHGPETSSQAVAGLQAALADGADYRQTLLSYRRDGSPFWNDLQLQAVRDAAGALTHVVALQSDLFSHPLGPEARDLPLADPPGEDRRSAMAQVLAHVPFGLVMVDPRFAISFVNAKAQELLGLEADGWAGRQLSEVVDDPALLAQIPLPSAVKERRVEVRLGRPRITLGVTVVRAELDGHRRPWHILAMRALAEVEPGHQDLEQLRRLTALGRMAAGFAHQVRNPLAAVRSLAEAMREELDVGDDRREYTRRILALVERVENLVRRALRFTHSGAPRLRAMAPAELIHQAFEILDGRWRDAGETARVDLRPDLPRVLVDRDHGVEILMVLIENALDATTSPREVEVTAAGPIPAHGATAGDFVVIEVRDSGAGIPADVLSQIFDPFFTTKPRGTGLGLPIAMRLANESSARLEVASEEGRGTVFRLLLPVVDSPEVS